MISKALIEIPKEIVSRQQLERELTIYDTDIFGDVKPSIYFKENGSSFFVPRQFGYELAKFNQIRVHEESVEVSAYWPTLFFLPGVDYREGQKETVEKVTHKLKQQYHGLLLAKTGSGKCLMSLDIASRLNQKTLILVHKTDLIDGFVKVLTPNNEAPYFRLVKYSYLKDCVDNDSLLEESSVVFSTFQYIHRNLQSLQKYRDKFGFIIVDEGHHTPARTFNEVFSVFEARYRLLLSATFRRKDDKEKVWQWHVGGILHEHKNTRLSGQYVCYPTHTKVPLKKRFYGLDTISMISYIVAHGARNNLIATEIDKAVSAGRKLLVISDRVAHLEMIRYLSPKHVKDKSALYTSKYNKKENLAFPVIFSTFKMMEEGTDVPELDTLFIITPKKDVEQVVGRIQRVYDNKKSLLVVYFLDDNPWCHMTWNSAQKVLQKVGINERSN
jgi:superfamily II DNA or RNA helicase